MSPKFLQLDGVPNPNLPVRPRFPRKPEPPYRGPFDIAWTEGPTGRLVMMKSRRQKSSRVKRALSKFKGPWKSPRWYGR
jgi:hypothetical protein